MIFLFAMTEPMDAPTGNWVGEGVLDLTSMGDRLQKWIRFDRIFRMHRIASFNNFRRHSKVVFYGFAGFEETSFIFWKCKTNKQNTVRRTRHYLSQCRPRPLLWYAVTRSQWMNFGNVRCVFSNKLPFASTCEPIPPLQHMSGSLMSYKITSCSRHTTHSMHYHQQ